MLLAGAKVPYQEKGKTKYYVLKLIDFDHPQKNEFLAIRQFWVKHHELKKLDHVIFINGIPLVLLDTKILQTKMQQYLMHITNCLQLIIKNLFQEFSIIMHS